MVGEINEIGGLHVAVDPMVLLVGICATISPNMHTQLFSTLPFMPGKPSCLNGN